LNSRAFILIPAYNEEKALARLIPAIAQAMQESGRSYLICVVDDGSRDGTAALLTSSQNQYPLKTLVHETNRGYGAALHSGFRWIAQQGRPEDAVVSLDGDNTHPPVYIPALLSKLDAGYDVVTASYWGPGAKAFGVPPLRRLMSFGANTLFKWHFPIEGTYAYTNGFRAYRVALLQRALARWADRLIEETGFAGGTELLMKACGPGARTTEVPFELHYENRGNDSKINIPRTVSAYVRLLGRARALR